MIFKMIRLQDVSKKLDYGGKCLYGSFSTLWEYKSTT